MGAPQMNHKMISLVPFLLCVCATPPWTQDAPPANYPWEAYDADSIMMPGVYSNVYKQGYGLSMGGKTVRRLRSERADASSEWNTQEEEFTLSYYLTSWCGREGGDVIYLCGLKASGEAVIEKWTFSVPNGRWVVRYPGAPPPIGTPASAYEPHVAVKGGGQWKWNSKVLPYPPSPQKTIIMEGSIGPFTSMAVDPEGRQLVLYDYGEKAIERIALLSSPPFLEILYSVSTFPHVSQVAALDIRDFGAEGRKLLMWKQYKQTYVRANEVYTIASDPNNDGNFEAVAFYPLSQFEASPYSDWPTWKEFWRLE